MKYHLIISKVGETVQYTEAVLKKLIADNNHKLVDPIDADIILVSICDITEIKLLKQTREKYPKKIIVVGGAISFFYKTLILFSDIVNVGQGFEFFECQSLEEIKALKCTYTGNETHITPSVKIEWKKSPIVQVAKKLFYYWGGVGCKNKCSFCLVSWCNKHESNYPLIFNSAKKAIGKNSLKIISNEEEGSIETKEAIKDLMLTTYLNSKKTPNCRIIRIGLEFATEKNRKENGKYFTDQELFQVMHRAKVENKMLQFFCIGGLDTREEWIDLFQRIPEQYELNPKIVFKFTNLEYQMHTPLYKKRFELKKENYLDNDFNLKLMKLNRYRLGRMRTLPIKYPAHAFWRMGTSTSIARDQFDLFWELRNCKDLEILYQAYMKSGVIQNDYTKEVNWWYKNNVKT